MADVIATTTTHVKFIGDVWAKDLIIARESALVMSNLVRRFDLDFASGGDVLHIPLVSNLTGGDISTTTGLLDSEAPTETEVTLTINKWKGVNMKVLDIVLAQSMYDFRRLYTERMGYRLGQLLEQDLTVLAASITNTVGTFNTDLQDTNFRRAVQYLDDGRVPFSDRHMIIKPAQKNVILGIDKFVRYDATGSANRAFNGQVPGEMYGVTTHVSPETYITGTSTSNLMFHKDCLMLGILKGIKVEQFARVGWLDHFGASELYGVGIMRNDHGCELRS